MMTLKICLLLAVILNPAQQQQGIILRISSIGATFQPLNSADLIETQSSVNSISQCAMSCLTNTECRTLEYDRSSLMCRLFGAWFNEGSIIQSTSHLAYIEQTPALYFLYGQICDSLFAVNRFLSCINGYWRCPAGQFLNGSVCQRVTVLNITTASALGVTTDTTASIITTTTTIETTTSVTTQTTTTTTTTSSATTRTTTTSTASTTGTTTTNMAISATTTAVPPNLLTNPGAESALTGWTQTGVSSAIQDTGGIINIGYNPRTGSGCFAGGFGSPGAPSSLFQRVTLLGGPQNFVAAELDAGTLKVDLVFFFQNWYNLFVSMDDAQVTITYRSATNTSLGNFSSGPQLCSSNPGWCPYSTLQNLPVGTRSIDYTMAFIRNGGTNIDSYIDDNSLRVI